MNIVILETIGISLEECQKQLPDHRVIEVPATRRTPEQRILRNIAHAFIVQRPEAQSSVRDVL